MCVAHTFSVMHNTCSIACTHTGMQVRTQTHTCIHTHTLASLTLIKLLYITFTIYNRKAQKKCTNTWGHIPYRAMITEWSTHGHQRAEAWLNKITSYWVFCLQARSTEEALMNCMDSCSKILLTSQDVPADYIKKFERVRARSLVLFPLSPFPSELWSSI